MSSQLLTQNLIETRAEAFFDELEIRLPQRKFDSDRIATAPGVSPKKLSEIMQFIFHGRLMAHPKRKKSSVDTRKSSNVQTGWIHMGLNKKDLVAQRDTKFVRTYSTFLYNVSQGYEYMTFGTFNTKSRACYDRSRKQLNSVHAFVIDIDSKKWTLQEILSYCEKIGIMPSFVNGTPRGFHIWFVLEADINGPHEKEKELTKAGQFYNDMNRFLIKLFEERFPDDEDGTDPLIGGERYIRIPTNIVFYSGLKHSILSLAQIKKSLYKEPKIEKAPGVKAASNNSSVYIPFVALEKDPAFKELLSMQPKTGQRRKTAFTIALTYYALNVTPELANQYLKAWYERLENKTDGHSFTWQQVERQIKDAYSGKFGGPHAKWVYILTGIKPTVYFTRRNPLERKNSTQSNWERLFLQLLKDRKGVWEISNRQLCDALDLTSNAMLELMIKDLESSGVIEKEVIGRGRYAMTRYRLIQKNNGTKSKKLHSACIVIPFSPKVTDEKYRDSINLLMPQNRIEDLKSIYDPGGG